jgi:hypothetical protein
MFYDAQQIGTLLSRNISEIITPKASKVNDNIFMHINPTIQSISFREFSDCAIGVLDKLVADDKERTFERTFEMLDMRHAVSKIQSKVLKSLG